jgi:mono/diheme cytochrome c family protein
MREEMLFCQSYLKRVRPLGALILPSVVLLALLCCVAASASSDVTAPAESVKQGSEIFNKRCIVCHNKQPGDNTPFGPPNLYTVFHARPTLTTPQAETIVTHGRGQMPAFGTILSHTEIRSVIAYLRKRAATAAPNKQ